MIPRDVAVGRVAAAVARATSAAPGPGEIDVSELCGSDSNVELTVFGMV